VSFPDANGFGNHQLGDSIELVKLQTTRASFRVKGL
jgi:hypothetical protein